MADLFFRDGTSFTGTAIDADSKKPYTRVRPVCSRCGGAGRSEAWRFTGYTCYACGGSGRAEAKVAVLYTAEKLAKLNATKDKKLAAKAAKYAAAQVAQKAAADAKRGAFEAQYADVLGWLGTAGRDGDGYRDGFLGDMLRRAVVQCEWTPGQADAVLKSFERAAALVVTKAASSHVGTVGERLVTIAKVEHEIILTGRHPVATWLTQDTYITFLRDTAGNKLVIKSTSFRSLVGRTIEIRGSVKEHTDYKGEAQTVLQRAKIVREINDLPATA